MLTLPPLSPCEYQSERQKKKIFSNVYWQDGRAFCLEGARSHISMAHKPLWCVFAVCSRHGVRELPVLRGKPLIKPSQSCPKFDDGYFLLLLPADIQCNFPTGYITDRLPKTVCVCVWVHVYVHKGRTPNAALPGGACSASRPLRQQERRAQASFAVHAWL